MDDESSIDVFVVSTTGDDDPPDTVSKLWRRQILELGHFMRLDLLMMEWGKNYTGINFILLGGTVPELY